MSDASFHSARERAAAFVAAHGSALDTARAELLLGRGAADTVLARLDWRAEPASTARRALAVCDDLRLLHAPPVEKLARELAGSQAQDGGWAAGQPLEERLCATGMIAGHLTKTRVVRPATLGAAADFLAEQWSPERVRGGSWESLAAYAHLFANTDHEFADRILQWCGRELSRGFATRTLDAVRTARVLVHCDAHGLPGGHLAPDELAAALLAEQEADGGFPPGQGSGTAARVESTLDALVALVRLARGAPSADPRGPGNRSIDP